MSWINFEALTEPRRKPPGV